MARRMIFASFPLLFILLLPTTAVNLPDSQGSDYVQNQVIIKFKKSTPPREVSAVAETLNSSLIYRIRSVQAELWEIRGITVEDAIEQLKDDPRIDYIEPNYFVYADGTFPNDPGFSELWGLYNTGESGGVPDADIDATDAWDIETGGEVLVGVVDTGVDYLHEDLADHVFSNTGEIPDNGVDEDGNGYVDDIRGWDFVNNDNDPIDDSGHGTHVAGTIAAIGNNGTGVVGVSWSAKILPLKFLDQTGRGDITGAVLAIEYANMMGAKVTNHSWSAEAKSKTLELAVEAARYAGAFVVTSAGNENVNIERDPRIPNVYPYDNVITVANTTREDVMASSSNYGSKSVDLGAPGTRILSCAPGDRYAVLSGTSMSAPHVCGAISLIWAADPSLTYLEVRDLLLSSTDPLPSLQDKTVTGGRLNIFKALAKLDSIPPARVTDLEVVSTELRSVTLRWTASGDDGSDGTARRYDLRYSVSPIDPSEFDSARPVENVPGPLPSGSVEWVTVEGLESNTTYYFVLKVLDERHASAASNIASGVTLSPDPPPHVAVSPTSIVKTLMTGGTAEKTIQIENSGTGDLEWRMELEDISFVPGRVAALDPVQEGIPRIISAAAGAPLAGRPPSLAPGILAGVTIAFDASHGQLQDSWNTIISDLTRRGAAVVVNTDPITPGLLSGNDILWITDSHVFTEWSHSELAALYEWVWSGGGLLLEGDNEPSVALFNGILSSLRAGIRYAPEPGTSGSTALISAHETTLDVGSILLDLNLSHLASVEPPAEVLIRDVENAPAAAYSHLGSGRIVALTDELFEDSRMGADDNQLFANQVFDWLARGYWLAVSKRTGMVPAGDADTLTLAIDGFGLAGGIYEAGVVVRSNDPLDPSVTVRTTLGITSVGDIEVSRESMEFGVVYTGFPATDSLLVYNSGTDELVISDISVVNDDYSVDLHSFSLEPGRGQSLIVRCSPSRIGPIIGALTITSNDPDEAVLEIELRASGIDPPDISVSPESLNESLYGDQRVIRTITLSNEGGSDLSFDLAVEAPDTAAGGRGSPGSRRLGHPGMDPNGISAPSLPEAIEEEWIANVPRGAGDELVQSARTVSVEPNEARRFGDVSGLNTLFADDFEDGDYDGWEDMGMGKNIVTSSTAANFTRYSYLEYDSPIGHFNGIRHALPEVKPSYIGVHIRPGDTGEADGYFLIDQIGGLHILYVFFSSSGKICVNAGQLDQDVTVPYKANRWYWVELKNIDYETKTFDYYLDKILIKPNMSFMQGATSDGIAWVHLYNYTVGARAWWDEIVFSHGDIWLSMDPVSGTIPAGGHADIEVTIDATLQVSGDYTLISSIESNDPDEPVIKVPVNLNVTGVPNMVIADSLVDFGDVIVGGSGSVALAIYNAGFEHDLVISDITGPNISSSPDSFAVKPRDTRNANVKLSPTAPGQVSGDIVITSNDRDQSVFTIPFVATAFPPPILSVEPDSIYRVQNAGRIERGEVSLRNSAAPGASDLDYSMLILDDRYHFLTIDTYAGSVPPGCADTVGLYFNSMQLNVGTYPVQLVVRTNIPDLPTVHIPIVLEVQGTPSIRVSATVVDFGVVYLGHPTTRSLEVSNRGADTLIVSDVSISEAGFSAMPDSLSISPKSSKSLDITCTPISTGNVTAIMSITSNDTTHGVVEVTLEAEVLEAPELVITPDSIGLSIREGKLTSTSLALANHGASDIDWELDLTFVDPARIEHPGGTAPLRAAQSDVSGLMDILWYGDHGLFGIPMRSTIFADLTGRGATITQHSGLLTAELLRDYDILWLGDTDEMFTSAETEALTQWLLGGGGLLIEADNHGSIQAYDDLLEETGSGVQYIGGTYSGGMTQNIEPHETTFGVNIIMLLNPQAVLNQVYAPAGVLARNMQNLVIAAHSTVGKGRLVALADQLFTDIGIGIGNTRDFANQVFDWLAGVNWLSITPLMGALSPGDQAGLEIGINTSHLIPGAYQVNVEIGSNDPSNPVVTVPVYLIVRSSIPRTVDLALEEGLNLRSWNIEASAESTAALIEPIEDKVLSIQGFDGGGLVYDPSIPPQFNTLITMDQLHGYWIRTGDTVTWSIDGFQFDHRTPIHLSEGYNLVSYLPEFEDSAAHALESIAGNLIVALGYDQGGLTYDPNIPPEFNTLQILKPGFGYWVKMSEADTLVYPDGPVTLGGEAPVAESSPAKRGGNCRVVPTREWMSVWGDDIRIGGKPIANGTVVTAVDPDGIVCGEFTMTRDGKLGLMPVYRNDPETELDEGAEVNDEITLLVADLGSISGIRWTGLGDVVDLKDEGVFVEAVPEQPPKRYALYQNFPNPFNPTTTIRYDLAKFSSVRLAIFTVQGERIRNLVDKMQPPGRYAVQWDGRSSSGESVSSGIYFYKLDAGGFVRTKKMLLLK